MIIVMSTITIPRSMIASATSATKLLAGTPWVEATRVPCTYSPIQGLILRIEAGNWSVRTKRALSSAIRAGRSALGMGTSSSCM